MLELTFSFVSYFVVLGGIAVFAYRYTRTHTDYALGGRRLSPSVTALSAGASDMSGWLLLGLPGAVYVTGIAESWLVLGLVIGCYLNWRLVAPRLRQLTGGVSDSGDVDSSAKTAATPLLSNASVTLPEFFANQTNFTGKSLRIVASIAIIVFFTVYTAGGFVAGGKLLNAVLGIDYTTAVWIGVLLVMTYTAIGGFLAVSWTDAFQASLMIVALVAVCVLAAGTTGSAEVGQLVQLPESLGIVTTISLLAWGLGYFGQPHILVRFMAIEKASLIPRARRIGMSWMVVISIAAIGVGLFGTSLLPDLVDPEHVFIELTRLLLNPWVAGIVVAAILAAVMSTVDSQLLVSSTSVVHDLLGDYSHNLWLSRGCVVLVALVAGWIASAPDSMVLAVVAYAWAGLGASFGPCVLFVLFWRRTTGPGVIGGIVTGAAVTIGWHEFVTGRLGDIYEIVPAFVLASLAIYLISRFGRNASTEASSA